MVRGSYLSVVVSLRPGPGQWIPSQRNRKRDSMLIRFLLMMVKSWEYCLGKVSSVHWRTEKIEKLCPDAVFFVGNGDMWTLGLVPEWRV